jgi:hypothetical protein
MLDGFKFCHHCGKSISVATASPELTFASLKKPDLPQDISRLISADDEILPEIEELPADVPVRFSEYNDFSAGRVFIVELLCYIPIFNFILLAIMSTMSDGGRESSLREYARGKLLAAMTVFIFFLLAALTVIILMAFEVIEPIFLGRWGR